MIISTLERLDGYRVKKVLGVVYASRAVGVTTAALDAEIEAVIAKLERVAREKGANAVLGLRLDARRVAGVGGEWVLLIAYGTAVELEEES